jgi:hypothetical protein
MPPETNRMASKVPFQSSVPASSLFGGAFTLEEQRHVHAHNYQIFIFAFCGICSQAVEKLSMAFPFQFVVQIP